MLRGGAVVTRAGEKLYGDRDASRSREGLFASRRFWTGFAATLALILVAGAALLGFG